MRFSYPPSARADTPSSRSGSLPHDRPRPPRREVRAVRRAGGGNGLGLSARPRRPSRIWSATQLRALGLPVLATLPNLFPPNGDARSYLPPMPPPIVSRSTSGWSIAPTAGFSARIQAVKSVLTADKNNRGRSVLVLSVDDGRAKSAISLCVALSGAVAGEKTLLIECDEHERALPMCLRHWTGRHSAGTASKTSGSRMFARTRLRGCDFCRRRPDRVWATAFRQRGQGDVLGRVKRFDLVIIDGMTNLAGEETRAFADVVDHIILVIATGQTRLGDLDRLGTELGVNSDKVAGVVLVGAQAAQAAAA